MNAILAIAHKDLKLLLRDKTGFFFTFFFPIIIAVFFGSIFSDNGGKPVGLHVMIVDNDQSVASEAFIAQLEASDEVSVQRSLKEEAVERVRLGKEVAYIEIKKGFGDAQERMFWGAPPEIELGIDPARRGTAGMLQGILMKYGVNAFQKRFSDPSLMRRSIQDSLDGIQSGSTMDDSRREHLTGFLTELDAYLDQPTPNVDGTGSGNGGFGGMNPLVVTARDVALEKRGPQSGYAISFPQGIMWGIIGCAASFGVSLVIERTRGTLMRLRTAPIDQLHILGGKALACFVTTCVLAAGTLGIAMLFFGIRPNSLVLLGISIISISFEFVGIMMLLSVLGRTERSAAGIGWAVLMMMSMIGGGMLPLFIMPEWMQTVSDISPVKWAMIAMEGSIWRQFSLNELLVPWMVLWGIGSVGFLSGVWMFRRSRSE